MTKWQRLLQKLKSPHGWVLAVVYILTATFIIGACTILLVDYIGTPLEILAYTLFALAALFLGYSIYTFVLFFPKWKRGVITALHNRKFTRELIQNYGFRTVVTAICSFAFNILYGLFYGVLGILERSIWFGALAAYYIILSFIKGGVLLYHKNKRKKSYENPEYTRMKTYRNSGILLVVINAALSAAIAQMIFNDETFRYDGLLIYASAAYAFYKITMAIYNLFRAKKEDDITIQAIRNINLTNAAVSILALQTALLATFTDGSVDISIFNTITGCIVSLLTWSIGIYMVVQGTKRMKKIKSENIPNERTEERTI